VRGRHHRERREHGKTYQHSRCATCTQLLHSSVYPHAPRRFT
jgi:hypothetical protein